MVISDAEVSRHHVQITNQGDGFVVEDLDSTNGTFLNGERITGPSRLSSGDLIDLGSTIRLEFSPPATAPYPTFVEPDAAHPWHLAGPDATEAPELVPSRHEEELGIAVRPRWSRRRWFLGCGCGALLLVFLCGASLFFLDAYDGGRLLYCGPLQPLFELVLGPVGFSPACAIP